RPLYPLSLHDALPIFDSTFQRTHQSLQALLDNPNGFFDFIHPYLEAIPAISDTSHLSFPRRNVKFQFGIYGIFIDPAQIPFNSGSAQHWAGTAIINGNIGRQRANVRRARYKNLIIREQFGEFGQLGFEIADKIATPLLETDR